MTDGDDQANPARWERDPTDPNRWRWWDGEGWTERTSPIVTPPAPVTEQQPGLRQRKLGPIPVPMLIVIAVAGFLIVSGGLEALSDDVDDSNDSRVVVPPAPTCEVVKYFVGGSANSASLTMERPRGTEQVTVGLPMKDTKGNVGLQAGCFEPGAFTYISAQNEGERGSVTCRIERDGLVVSEATSSGAYVIATCSD